MVPPCVYFNVVAYLQHQMTTFSCISDHVVEVMCRWLAGGCHQASMSAAHIVGIKEKGLIFIYKCIG